MADQFAKYKTLSLLRWLCKERGNSLAIEHYLEILSGDISCAQIEWTEKNRSHDGSQNLWKPALVHQLSTLPHISDVFRMANHNDPCVIAILDRLFANNPTPASVRKYMDIYVANLDGSSEEPKSGDKRAREDSEAGGKHKKSKLAK